MDLSICALAALQQPERWPLVILGCMFLLPAMHVRRCGPLHLRSRRRYVLQTLRNSRSLVDTIDQADVVYVYDYCYHMRALADHHAQRHWWLKNRYNLERTTGKHLLMAYRSGHVLAVHSFAPRALLH